MDAPIEYFRVTAAKRALLEHVADEVFDHAIDPQALSAFLDDPRHLLVVAVSADVVVGMASAFEYFHPDKRPQIFINEVGVAPDYRRRGIGRQLVAMLLDAGRERGCVYAWLGTAADNAEGRACFGSVPGVGEPEPFLLYEWKLGG
ncbi:MAG: GNAT family N-acetyltransferase [Woeseiaceae bacterium]|nr:GNAT family N-acetyltransferase [Woeseiaceae bacterium]